MKCEWKECVLSDVADIVDSLHKTPKYTEYGIPMLRVTDIKEGYLSLQSSVKVSLDIYDEFTKKHKPEIGDIVISRVGTYGVFSYVNTDEKFCLGQNTAIIIPHINTKYLYYFLISPMVKKYLSSVVTGSTQKTISLKNIKTIPLQIPSDVIQKKIAYILSALDDKIECNNKINENLQQQAQAIFKAWFIDNDEIPNEWRKGNLLEIANYLNGLAMQKYRPTGDEIGIPVLKIKELRQGHCDASSDLCSSNIKSEYIIEDGDVIFSWSGSLLVDIWCGGTCGLNQHLFKVTSDHYDKWFYYLWTVYHLNRFIAVAADKATTMGHIKRGELAKAEVIIPSKEDYQKINSTLSPIFELIISNRIESRKLAQVRDALLPKLMSGEIDVEDVES